jgi:hypothetical protein
LPFTCRFVEAVLRRFVLVACCVLVAGCHHRPEQTPANSVDINSAAEAARGDIANYAAANAGTDADANTSDDTDASNAAEPAAPGTPGGLPDDRTPVSEAPFTPDSAQGAANVVQTYYALIEAGKYRDAWALWDNGGQDSGQSADAFAASFAKYADYHAQIGAPGRIDAGAGQRYVTVPVQVYGKLRAGGKFTTLGSVTLHRAGDIDGATDAQKSWHLHSVDLQKGDSKSVARDPAAASSGT